MNIDNPLAQIQVEEKLDESTELINLRAKEINKIHQDIRDINELYQDLSTLVSTQVENIDRVETNLETAKINTERGLTDITKAAKQQPKCLIQ